MSSFQDSMVFVHNHPDAEVKRSNVHAQEREPVLPRIRLTPLGFCLGVIVNEKPLHFEKTTSSVLSMLLLI